MLTKVTTGGESSISNARDIAANARGRRAV